MACFFVPATEAVVTTAASKIMEHTSNGKTEKKEKAFVLQKLGMLNKMLWGGSALLAFEHVWHGELVPYFPFLTAMNNPNDAYEMLHEMSTVGVTMAAAVTAVWAAAISVEYFLKKTSSKSAQKL